MAAAHSSPGPITIEGKQRSSANALKHGLTARLLRLSEEDTPIFEQMRADFEAQIAPRGPLEAHAFDQLLLAAWNLRRAALLSSSIDPLDDSQAAQFQRLELYQRRLERSYYRATAELRALQTERLTRDAILADSADDDTKAAALAMPLVNWPRLRSHLIAEQTAKQRITDRSYQHMLGEMMSAPPGASFSVTRFD